MKTVGIIAEYNPFHNGHLYHLNKVKEMFPDHLIVLVLSGNYTQKGTFSIISKYDKTQIALDNNIDLVIELPYNFVVQSADSFAKGSIQILNKLGVEKLFFGSESNDLSKLKEIASFIINESNNNVLIKEEIKKGFNYPSSINKIIKNKFNYSITEPNDILGLCYIKEIIINNYNITPYSIKRTNDYNDIESKNKIVSATNIREKLKNKKNINKYIPLEINKYINNDLNYDFFLLKYNIINNIESLDDFLLVNKSLANLIKKYIFESNNTDELINKIKNKSITYNNISRALCNIVCNYKKVYKYENIEYLNILGASKKGIKYLNQIKKNIDINLITKFSDFNKNIQNIEYSLNWVYYQNKISKNDLKKSKIIIK